MPFATGPTGGHTRGALSTTAAPTPAGVSRRAEARHVVESSIGHRVQQAFSPPRRQAARAAPGGRAGGTGDGTWLAVDEGLQFLARLEIGDALGRHGHGLAGLG